MTLTQYSRTLTDGAGLKVRIENIANAIERNCRIGKITLKSA